METLAWTSKCCCIIGTNQKHPAIFRSHHSFIFFFPFCFFSCSRRSPEAGAAQPGDAAQDQSKAVAAGNGASQAVWNPFDDDTFSSLPAEEVKHEDKKPAGKKKKPALAAHVAHVLMQIPLKVQVLKLPPPLPDAPSELEQTSCVELIPGLQALAADSSSQESGASRPPPSCEPVGIRKKRILRFADMFCPLEDQTALHQIPTVKKLLCPV